MHTISLSDSALFDYVEASGPDASSFLQGQLTCNLEKLGPNNSLKGALCNLKGRVVADMHLFLLDPERIWLQTSQGNGQKIVDTLSRYAVFSKVELSPVDGPARVVGLIGEPASETVRNLLSDCPAAANEVCRNESFLAVRIAGQNPRYQLWSLDDDAARSLQQQEIVPEPDETGIWEREDVLAGIVHVTSETSELYTPQLLNYDISGVIDFEKGCYTGQEVVARMHYRAKPKKRLYRLCAEQAIARDARIVIAGNSDETVVELLAVAPQCTPGESGAALGIVSKELADTAPKLELAMEQPVPVQIFELDYSAGQ